MAKLVVLILILISRSGLALPLCGDCNGGGSVDILDSLTASQIVIELITPSGQQLICCDVNNSSAITIRDVVLIAQFANGLGVMLTCM